MLSICVGARNAHATRVTSNWDCA